MRETMLFNDGWTFQHGDIPGAEAATFAAADWNPVTLPHDWSIAGPFDERWASATGYLPGGIGWYRKSFTLPARHDTKHVFVHFDGVYCRSDVWLNGQHLGHRPNGHIGFRYDLTPHLNHAGDNVLAVRVDHSQFGDARWYTGSGINRHAWLISTEAVHIAPWGVCVTTPLVTDAQADVFAEVTVRNVSAQAATVLVEQTVQDASGQSVAQGMTIVQIAPTQETNTLLRVTVREPQSWSPETPNLYTLRTTVHQYGVLLDCQDTPFGIRTFQFDPNMGFHLNGKSVKLKGVCLHDDAGALGTAVPAKVWRRRLATLKAGGVNAIRMSHNPHMPELYDLCDQMGFLVQDEAFDEWELGKNKWIAGWNVGQPGRDGTHSHFAEWAETDLRDLLLANRNHPSIVMWSIGNEIDYPNDPYSHPVLDTGTNPQIYGRGCNPAAPHADRLGEIARQLTAIVKRYDTTRPVTAGLASALISNETGFADALDVVGYNYQEGRYAGDHALYPNRVLYGSENGMRYSFWQAVASNDYICGQFLWTGIDYLGEAGKWPARSNGAGLLDLAGLPKPEYYFRQSLWTTAPMAYLGTRPVPSGEENDASLWRHNAAEPVWRGTSGELVRVCGFTNCERAELFVSGASAGVRTLADADDSMLTWDISYTPGIVTMTAYASGQEAATASLQTHGPAVKLHAAVDTETLQADGIDLAHIVVTIVDEYNVPVYDASNEVTWTIIGPAKLRGLESGDHASHEDYQGNRRKAFRGRLLGYVQATRASGDITIKLSAPGLTGATVTLQAQV